MYNNSDIIQFNTKAIHIAENKWHDIQLTFLYVIDINENI